MRNKLGFVPAAAVLLAACGGSGESGGASAPAGADAGGGAVPAAADPGCPDEAQVRAAVEKFDNRNVQSAAWRITGARNFQFGPMQFGTITDEQVKWGAQAQAVCPVRFTYTYETVSEDGSTKPASAGEGQTFFFFKDGFGDWIYRTGS